MHRYILFFLLLFSLLNAREIHPTFALKSMGLVNDFVVAKDKIYIANDAGSVDIFDLKNGSIIKHIFLKLTTSGHGNLRAANVLSVDYLNDKLLIVSIGKDSYRNVWIYENNKLINILNEDAKLTIKEGRFLNSEKVVLATFSSEIHTYDIAENYITSKKHISQSTLGDITLSEDKSKIIMSDESGEIKVLNAEDSSLLYTHSSQNVDNVYYVAYANNTLITAGQDRRVGVYKKGQKDYHIKSDFLVYCVGVSPSGDIGVYSSGFQSDLQLFNTTTREKLDTLVGHKGIVNQIKFINEKELFSSERDDLVFYWNLS